ncbi:MAG: site-2 protease family protein, partial [Anaerolineae bacterium]
MTDTATYQTQLLRDAASDTMLVEDVTEGLQSPYTVLFRRDTEQDSQRDDVVRLRGRLLLPASEAYERLAQRFRPLGYTPLLRRDGDRETDVVLALPGAMPHAKQRVGVAALLFALTLLSCLFAGAQMVEGLTALNWNLLEGLPYAASLLAILAAHEFGHYLMARRLGTPVSLPYFIPMPVGFGTFGAFINMTAPPRNRRHLLGIAAAGPLAGLAVALPVLWIGLSLSRVEPLPAAGAYSMEGNSLLYVLMKFLAFGQILPSNGVDVFIHPVAFAGWAGLLVTALNLIPAGQLDGGHIMYALVGEKAARAIYWIVLAALAALSLLWPGWLLWLGLIFIFGRIRAEPLDDVTELTPPQRVLAAVMVLIFFLVFTPVPMTLVQGPEPPTNPPATPQTPADGVATVSESGWVELPVFQPATPGGELRTRRAAQAGST